LSCAAAGGAGAEYVLVWDGEGEEMMAWDERERLTDISVTLASYLFGALIVAVIVCGALELIGWLPLPE